jgi:hypothetical protein
MSKFNIGDVLKKVVDVGSNILPVPGGKLIGDLLENVIDEVTDGPDAKEGPERKDGPDCPDGPDGKEKSPGNGQGRNGNRRMNRRRLAK